MVAGIYAIHNVVANKYYIGCSADIQQRWKQHLYSLNRNKHHSLKLQKAFDEFGIESFKFFILKETEDYDNFEKIELEYINQYDSCLNGYNSTIKGIKLIDYEEGSIRNLSNGKFIKTKDYDRNKRKKIIKESLGVKVSSNRLAKLRKLAIIQEKTLTWIIEDLIDSLPDPDSLS